MRTRLTGYGRLLSEALKGWRKDLEKMSVAQVRTVFGLVEGLGLVEGAKRPGKDVCCTGAHALAQVRMRLHRCACTGAHALARAQVLWTCACVVARLHARASERVSETCAGAVGAQGESKKLSSSLWTLCSHHRQQQQQALQHAHTGAQAHAAAPAPGMASSIQQQPR